MSSPKGIARLRTFVIDLASAIDRISDPAALRAEAQGLLAALIAQDDWLPAACAEPDADHYRQYLLHCDSLERFSIVSFVWGPGQSTPIHDHRTWGLIGMLRGSEISQAYARDAEGRLTPDGPPEQLMPGDVAYVSPESGDIHRVTNAHDDRASISIHVYGANIGAVRRAAYDAEGRPKLFISGYANDALPNLWDIAKDDI